MPKESLNFLSGMVEWLMATDLKSVNPQGFGGPNPSPATERGIHQFYFVNVGVCLFWLLIENPSFKKTVNLKLKIASSLFRNHHPLL